MEVLKTKDIVELCHGNNTLIADYLRLHRGTAKRRISNGQVIVLDGEVYIKKGSVNNIALASSRKHRFEQYVDLAQDVLKQTNSIAETANLLCDQPKGKKRTEEKRQWVIRLTRWLNEGKLVL